MSGSTRPPAGGAGGSSRIEQLVRNNQAASADAYPGSGHAAPRLAVAVVTCMDARIDVFKALGLRPGDAHVIRNAGGAVTEDVIRSLVISQRLLGTLEVAVIHHSDCGMQKFRDDELKERIQAEVGIRPPFAMESFADLDADVRQSVARVKASPFLTATEAVRGFVYEVHSGRLREVA
jgi:carbonic anhydrase